MLENCLDICHNNVAQNKTNNFFFSFFNWPKDMLVYQEVDIIKNVPKWRIQTWTHYITMVDLFPCETEWLINGLHVLVLNIGFIKWCYAGTHNKTATFYWKIMHELLRRWLSLALWNQKNWSVRARNTRPWALLDVTE